MAHGVKFLAASAATIFLWSLFPIAASGVEHFSPFHVAILAQALALLSWSAYLASRREGFSSIYRIALQRPGLVLLSGFCSAVEYASFLAALQMADPLASTIIFEAWVVFMVLCNMAFFGAQVRARDVAVIALAFLGVGISSADPGDLRAMIAKSNGWLLLALLAALCAGAKAALNERISSGQGQGSSAVSAMAPHFLTGQVALANYLLLGLGMFLAQGEGPPVSLGAIQVIWPDLVRLIVLGVLIMGVGNPMFIHALRHRPSEGHSAVFNLIPVLAAFWLILAGKADLQFHVVAGGVMVMTSALTLSLRRSQ
jgi:drug/metabolite transporter (DMT)-like permease